VTVQCRNEDIAAATLIIVSAIQSTIFENQHARPIPVLDRVHLRPHPCGWQLNIIPFFANFIKLVADYVSLLVPGDVLVDYQVPGEGHVYELPFYFDVLTFGYLIVEGVGLEPPAYFGYYRSAALSIAKDDAG